MENRIFIPGSEWVYFKIYTGTKTADSILKNELYGYVNEMLTNDIIDKWFFIRYSDPDFHLRLRLHLKETRNFTYVFNRFFEIFQSIVDYGLAWKIQCDTYQREIERYGANTIAIVEDIFFIDSDFIIKMLHTLSIDNPEQHRWKLALTLIDSFLFAFSFELQQKKELLSTMAENYKKEFRFSRHHAKKQLDSKYRIYRKEIENSIMLWEESANLIRARKLAIFPIAEKLFSMKLEVSLSALLISLIHMTMNRWFRTKIRLHEMVLYDFLSRYYKSEIAKITYIK